MPKLHLWVAMNWVECLTLCKQPMAHRSVTVKAKSSKAKNRLVNTMDGNPVCIVEQDTGEELFLVSENRKYCFWVSLRSGICRFSDKTDAHWEVIDERRTPDGLARKNP